MFRITTNGRTADEKTFALSDLAEVSLKEEGVNAVALLLERAFMGDSSSLGALKELSSESLRARQPESNGSAFSLADLWEAQPEWQDGPDDAGCARACRGQAQGDAS